MIRRSEWRAAAAVCAALVGAGFVSGCEIETFFARLGAGSWLAVAAACAGLGFLTCVLSALAQRTHASSLPDLFGRLAGRRSRAAMHLLYGLLALITASAMTAAGGELGALALDLRHARPIGAAAVLLAGAWLAAAGVPALGRLGLIMALCVAGVYAALAVGPEGKASLSGEGLATAVPMGLLYAALNGALAGGVMTAAAREDVRPVRLGAAAALIMLVMLLPANAALLRCGERMRRAALPTVAMASCWGIAGYYIIIALMLPALVSTLSAMLTALRDQAAELGLPRTGTLAAAVLLAAALSACGFTWLVNAVYPALGWACAFALLCLVMRWPRDMPGT